MLATTNRFRDTLRGLAETMHVVGPRTVDDAFPVVTPAGGAPLADGLIQRSDVAAFLDGTAWPHTTYHGTRGRPNYEHVAAEGVHVAFSRNGYYGTGIYTGLRPQHGYRPYVETAIRTTSPLVVDGRDALAGALHLRRPELELLDDPAIRQRVLDSGFDSLVIKRPDETGGDWLLALTDDQVRVVVEPPGSTAHRPPSPRAAELPLTTPR